MVLLSNFQELILKRSEVVCAVLFLAARAIATEACHQSGCVVSPSILPRPGCGQRTTSACGLYTCCNVTYMCTCVIYSYVT